MSQRRLALFVAALLFGGLATRRAHANRDPSELSVGGSIGSHDSHISCGPDVRVRHASGGFVYSRTFESDTRDKGEGPVIDLRAGMGTTTIADVGDKGVDSSGTPNSAQTLYANESDRPHLMASAQVSAGWDWGTVAILGGLGYFGLSDVNESSTAFRAHYFSLPSFEARFGRKTGFSAVGGLGAAPLPGLTRWYSTYAIGQYRFKEGGEIGAGVIAVPLSQLDARSGFLFKGSVPLASWLSVGGFAVVDANEKSALGTFNWTGGASATIVLDGMD